MLKTIIERWADRTTPFHKGALCNDHGEHCAQGDVLSACGWTDQKLKWTDQGVADRAVADLLGISLGHSILLRSVNDRSFLHHALDALTDPSVVLGSNSNRILAFWWWLDQETCWHQDYINHMKLTGDADAPYLRYLQHREVLHRLMNTALKRDLCHHRSIANEVAYQSLVKAGKSVQRSYTEAPEHAIEEILVYEYLGDRCPPIYLELFGIERIEQLDGYDHQAIMATLDQIPNEAGPLDLTAKHDLLELV